MSSLMKLEQLSSAGPDVILLHGYGSDRQSWLATTPALLDTHSVWVTDLPAHGQSPVNCGDGSINTLAACVLAAADDSGLLSFHFIGHSLGGRIGMHLAGSEPDRVKSLVAFAPAGLGDDINVDFLTHFASATTIDDVHALLVSLVHDPKMIGRVLAPAVLTYLNKPGTREALTLISDGIVAAQNDVPATVQTIIAADIPRMVVWGATDKINTIDKDKAALFGGTLHVFDECGHLPHIERRVATNQLLAEFYSSKAS